MPNDIPTHEVELLPARKPELRTGAEIRPIIPRTVEEAFRLAQAIVGAGLAPDSYSMDGNSSVPDVQKILIGILKAAEVGLPPITGLSTIAIIRKRPCIWGDGAVALVQRTGLVEKIEQGFEGSSSSAGKEPAPNDFDDDFAAVYRIWRKGQDAPYEGRFSVRDAKRAHLWGSAKKAPWIEYPTRMLLARARAFALREGFADALAGLSIREEIEDLPAEIVKTDTSFLEDAPVGQASLPAPTEKPIMTPTIDTNIASELHALAQDLAASADEPSRTEGERAIVADRTPLPAEQIPERVTVDDPRPKPPEAADADAVDGAGSRSEAVPAERGGGSATHLDPRAIYRAEPVKMAGAAGENPAPIPTIEIVKPHGGKPDWSATRQALIDAFCRLPTVAACEAFRRTNSTTIMMLRTNAPKDHETYQLDAAAHELALREKGK